LHAADKLWLRWGCEREIHLLREHWNYISSLLTEPEAKPKAKPVSYTVPMAVVSQPIMATC